MCVVVVAAIGVRLRLYLCSGLFLFWSLPGLCFSHRIITKFLWSLSILRHDGIMQQKSQMTRVALKHPRFAQKMPYRHVIEKVEEVLR